MSDEAEKNDVPFEPWQDWEFAWESWNARRLADAERLGLPPSASRFQIDAEEARRAASRAPAQ